MQLYSPCRPPMKKSKTKKTRVKLPKDSLIVDYGVTRVVMPYRVSLDMKANKDINEMEDWCTTMFKPYSWRTNRRVWPGYIYFVSQHDLFIFRLRWG